MARERSYRHDVRCRHGGSNWMPKDGRTHGQQACGWEVRRGELERGTAFDAARQVEQAGSSDKGLHKEH